MFKSKNYFRNLTLWLHKCTEMRYTTSICRGNDINLQYILEHINNGLYDKDYKENKNK